jgi:hypothetical protein
VPFSLGLGRRMDSHAEGRGSETHRLQFSREYRRMFGVLPSRDALALRETAVLPSI